MSKPLRRLLNKVVDDSRHTLYLLYFGSLLILVSYLFYFCFCPNVIKYYDGYPAYFSRIVDSNNTNLLYETIMLMFLFFDKNKSDFGEEGISYINNFKHRVGVLNEQKNRIDKLNSDVLKNIFTESTAERSEFSSAVILFYFCNNNRLSCVRRICMLLILFGISFILLPSLEVFLMVWRKLLFL